MILDIGGRGDDVDETPEVLHSPRAIQVSASQELVAQRDGVDHVAAFGERDHRAEQETVPLAVEHGVVEQLGGLERRVLVEQHGAQHRLLRLAAPRSLATGELGGALSR